MKSALLLLPILLGLTSCAGYRLGSQLPADIRTVHVFIARNLTDEPLLENDVTRAVLSQLARDGSLRVVSEDEADALLFIEITGYQSQAIGFDARNRARPDEFRLLLQANTILTRRSSGATLVRSGTLEGRSTFSLVGDLTTSRRTALPSASEDLARRLVATITEAWITEDS